MTTSLRKAASIIALTMAGLMSACSGQTEPQDNYEGSGFHQQPLGTPNRKVPDSAIGMKSSFAPVVRDTAPAVVNVYAKRVSRRQVDPFWQMFGGVNPRPQVEQSLGSGVIVRGDGVVVTNNHVVQGGQEFMVVLNDRREFPAKLLLADERTDLAVLQLETNGEKFTTLNLDDGRDLEVGDLVLAIGNPFGVGQTVTNGIISALDRTDVGPGEGAFIQTDAAINPGNSGGALVDMDGDLIGINSFILSRSGSSAGVGFAIPSAMVRRVVDTALGGKSTLVRPWLGAKGDAVTSDIARSMNLPRPEGVLVSDIYKGSPADQAGLRTGDVITTVDGQPVNDARAIAYRMSVRNPGETAQLGIIRDGKPQSVKVKVQPPIATPAKDERLIKANTPLLGAKVVNMSPAVAEEAGIDIFAAPRGVLVYGIESNRAYAARAGFRPGDIIKDVNGTPITSAAQLEQILSTRPASWKISIVRQGQTMTAQFRA
ncbi:Do family serine endopeptidase [Asticcacaulis endophyticus]|nr:Do family serine endopeptidase [Asticcacaulis endophyticus]